MPRKKILIADDDTALLTLVRKILEAQDYKICIARDGYQAVEFARKTAPDLLILDINMPAGDGFGVHERIEKVSSFVGVPVIYITGEQSDRVAQATSHPDVVAVLIKPFEADELVSIVERALSGTAEQATEISKSR